MQVEVTVPLSLLLELDELGLVSTVTGKAATPVPVDRPVTVSEVSRRQLEELEQRLEDARVAIGRRDEEIARLTSMLEHYQGMEAA